MSKALMKSGDPNNARGIVAGVGSMVLPGLGQLINGETDKAIGVAVVALGAGAVASIGIPLIAPVAGLVSGVTYCYGIVDGFVQGRKKKR